MPRFKSKYNVFENNDELFSEAIVKENGFYLPETWDWDNSSQISIDDVVIWECLFEKTGPSGIYAAWAPYEELYIVTEKRTLVKEFFGPSAKELLTKYCVVNGIPVPVRYNKHKVKFLEGVAS
jgi:hypothetical protein